MSDDPEQITKNEYISREPPVNIGVLYTNHPDKKYDGERKYGETFGENNADKKNLEKNIGVNFIVMDYHSPAVEEIISSAKNEKDAIRNLKVYLEKFIRDNNIHGLISPGNDNNIISPGKNTDNNNRALMERALISVSKKLLMPYGNICGGEQMLGWEAVRRSIKTEMLENIAAKLGLTLQDIKESQDIKSAQVQAEFKKIFEGAFIDRYKQLVGQFHSEAKRIPVSDFDEKHLEACIKYFSNAPRDYLGKFFRNYFHDCLKELRQCEDASTKQAKIDEIFGKHDTLNSSPNIEFFRKYFAGNEPGNHPIAVDAKSDFRTMFDRYYQNYGEENGIVIINHSFLLTGHDHNPPEGYKNIDKHAMIFVGREAYTKNSNHGYGQFAYAPSDHNQAIVNTEFVKKYLDKSGIDISYVDSAEKIVKAFKGTGEQWLKATQFHPEEISVSDDDLKERIEELNKTPRNSDRYKELSGLIGANILMREFGEQARAHHDKYPDFNLPEKKFTDKILSENNQGSNSILHK